MTTKSAFPFVLALLTFILTAATFRSFAQNKTAAHRVRFDHSRTVLRDKIFYLLGAIEETPRIRKEISRDKALHHILLKRETEMRKALTSCGDMLCLAGALAVTPQERGETSAALGALYHRSRHLRSFVRNNIRASGFYSLSDPLSDSLLLMAAWKEEAAGFNHIIGAYLEHRDLQYPTIDSASFYVRSPAYFDTVRHTLSQRLGKEGQRAPFFSPELDACLTVLKLNGRDEAARFEPMTATNREAYGRIPGTDWKKYPYSAILVFGEGPEDPDVAISRHNKERCAAAARLFADGKAPFLIVSGGYVHPFRTRYCEALEMKYYLVHQLGVPAQAIILEPHARHTTTNIRNANRIIYNEGIPAGMRVLGVSTPSHIDYMTSGRLARTCKRDLGYVPYTDMEAVAPDQMSYLPSASSLQINAREPLDP
jgi:hypothetical protein